MLEPLMYLYLGSGSTLLLVYLYSCAEDVAPRG